MHTPTESGTGTRRQPVAEFTAHASLPCVSRSLAFTPTLGS